MGSRYSEYASHGAKSNTNRRLQERTTDYSKCLQSTNNTRTRVVTAFKQYRAHPPRDIVKSTENCDRWAACLFSTEAEEQLLATREDWLSEIICCFHNLYRPTLQTNGTILSIRLVALAVKCLVRCNKVSLRLAIISMETPSCLGNESMDPGEVSPYHATTESSTTYHM